LKVREDLHELTHGNGGGAMQPEWPDAAAVVA